MLRYSVLIQYDAADNIYVASVPELEGCMAHGKTHDEAAREIMVAMRLWLEVAKEHGDAIPKPHKLYRYVEFTL